VIEDLEGTRTEVRGKLNHEKKKVLDGRKKLDEQHEDIEEKRLELTKMV
jgi:hypothetical protein